MTLFPNSYFIHLVQFPPLAFLMSTQTTSDFYPQRVWMTGKRKQELEDGDKVSGAGNLFISLVPGVTCSM